LAVLDVFEDEKLLERSNDVGDRLRASLRELADHHQEIVDVRGLGAMVAFELGTNGDVSKPDAALTARVVAAARERGLLLLSCGVQGNVIRILVPLTATDELLDEGLAILADSLRAASV
jgi:4-aminobutyrate aminotransferase-like enzyme